MFYFGEGLVGSDVFKQLHYNGGAQYGSIHFMTEKKKKKTRVSL